MHTYTHSPNTETAFWTYKKLTSCKLGYFLSVNGKPHFETIHNKTEQGLFILEF